MARSSIEFFIFLDEFKTLFKEDNLKSMDVVVDGKVGGEKWKDMSKFETSSYIAEAQQSKQEYDKSM